MFDELVPKYCCAALTEPSEQGGGGGSGSVPTRSKTEAKGQKSRPEKMIATT